MRPENGTAKKRKEEEKPKKTADGWDEPEQYQTETCRFFLFIAAFRSINCLNALLREFGIR